MNGKAVSSPLIFHFSFFTFLFLAVHRCDGGSEVLFGYASAVADAQAVVVDGLRRVVQELGYAHAVGDAEAYEGVDAQLRRQFAGGGKEAPALLRAQQRHEALYEVGVDGEVPAVERGVK